MTKEIGTIPTIVIVASLSLFKRKMTKGLHTETRVDKNTIPAIIRIIAAGTSEHLQDSAGSLDNCGNRKSASVYSETRSFKSRNKKSKKHTSSVNANSKSSARRSSARRSSARKNNAKLSKNKKSNVKKRKNKNAKNSDRNSAQGENDNIQGADPSGKRGQEKEGGIEARGKENPKAPKAQVLSVARLLGVPRTKAILQNHDLIKQSSNRVRTAAYY